jgi:signal transduction histidine kinase
VTLIIADNGRGFDMNTISSNSYGITGMKGRLREIGGTLIVYSAPASGTTITAEVQLQPAGIR